jgi:hypothetical protein
VIHKTLWRGNNRLPLDGLKVTMPLQSAGARRLIFGGSDQSAAQTEKPITHN